MPTRTEPWNHGTPNWIDLATSDLEGAKRFYGAVFGWDLQDQGEAFGHYHMARIDGRAAAGLGGVQSPDQPTAWTVYVASDDADATVARARELGATVFQEPLDIPGNGKMAILADPQGAVFGVWQQQGMIGAEAYNEPGALVWEDVNSRDPDAGRTFYNALFDYEYIDLSPDDMTEGVPPGYQMFKTPGYAEPQGGIGPIMAPDMPPHWMPYFQVEDTATTVETARTNGGTILQEAVETPYGKQAVIQDPAGAIFSVMGNVPTQ